MGYSGSVRVRSGRYSWVVKNVYIWNLLGGDAAGQVDESAQAFGQTYRMVRDFCVLLQQLRMTYEYSGTTTRLRKPSEYEGFRYVNRE